MNKKNIKVVILAGGYGTRLGTLTKLKPKPMVDVCGKPIIEHIMQTYIKYGFSNFIVCAGYKSEVLKKYFNKKFKKNVLINTKNQIFIKRNNFSIRIVDTGKNSLTGGRIRRVKKFLKKDEYFHVTYGDGLSNINIKKLLEAHNKSKKIGTMTIVHPPARFGEVEFKKNLITSFEEKPQLQKGWINGGFFVFEPTFLKVLNQKNVMLEREPLQRLVKKKQLNAYIHRSFWFCMDNLRDKQVLEKLNKSKKKYWK